LTYQVGCISLGFTSEYFVLFLGYPWLEYRGLQEHKTRFIVKFHLEDVEEEEGQEGLVVDYSEKLSSSLRSPDISVAVKRD